MPRPPLLVDLDQPLEGQRRFISAWLGETEDDARFVVDPGPASTQDVLLAALAEHGVSRLDLVLLTHVHLDHAGATAALLERHPEARVAVHRMGRAHIVDPAALWDGSRKVLGRTAEVYGEPRPVPESALADDEELAARGIRVVPTPGHAPHHQSFVHDGTLYVGEAAGTYLDPVAEGFTSPEPAAAEGAGSGTEPGAGFYLRPATPPRFILEVALASLERLLALEPPPQRIAFAHHGLHTSAARPLLATARDQLLVWVEVARELGKDHLQRMEAVGKDAAPAPPAEPAVHVDEDAEEEFVTRCVERLLEIDPHFGRLPDLPADIRARERQFSAQTLRGILGHLADR